MELELKETKTVEVLHTLDSHTLFRYKSGPYVGMVISFMDVSLKIYDINTNDEVTDIDEIDPKTHYMGVSFRFNTVENPNNIELDDAYKSASGDALIEVLHYALE